MRQGPLRIASLICGAALVAVSGTALAATFGKAGLWQITITLGGGDAQKMPDMSNVPPQYQAMVQAQMKAHGVSIAGNSISVQQCMTADTFAVGKPPPVGAHDKNCTMTNVVYTGSHMAADMTCSGSYTRTGHVDFNWDSGDHFSGEVTVTGAEGGQTVTHDEKLDGHLLSATCH